MIKTLASPLDPGAAVWLEVPAPWTGRPCPAVQQGDRVYAVCGPLAHTAPIIVCYVYGVDGCPARAVKVVQALRSAGYQDVTVETRPARPREG